MIGIVLVSHSALLAEGLRQIAAEMSQSQVKIAAAGGVDEDTIGTNAERIRKAIETAYSDDGVLIFFDLGSALLSTELAIESFSEEQQAKIKLCDAPMVEGAVVAAVEASLGHTLEKAHKAALAARNMHKLT